MAPVPFRHSVCDELFGTTSFAEVCREIRAAGYEGVEVSPSTFGDDATTLDQTERDKLRRLMQKEGLCFTGLQWGASAPSWLHLTARDESLRAQSWEHLYRTIDLCGDLSICRDEFNSVMVLGSAKQRSSADGMTKREATDMFTHGLAHAAPLAESRGVRLIINPLSPDQTDVVTSLDEAVTIVRQIGSPALQTMFDARSLPDFRQAPSELIRRFAPYVQHVYVSEADTTPAGVGTDILASLFTALSAAKYNGWISLTSSNLTGAGHKPVESMRETIEQSLQFLQKQEPEMAFTQTA